MLGIEREASWGEEENNKRENNNHNNVSDQKKKIKKATRKKSMNDNLLLKSFKCLNLDDSFSTYTRKSFCEVDIFTSDDDSFAIVDGEEDNELEKSINDDGLVDAKDKVSSCVQCDLSHEEPPDSATDTQNTPEAQRDYKTAGNITISSGSEFHDATASLEVKSDNLVAWTAEDFSEEAVLVQNETVYQDCEEELDESVEIKDEDDDDASDRDAIDESEGSPEQCIGGGFNASGNNSGIEEVDEDIYDDDSNDEDDESESENDSSWRASGTDISDQSDDDEVKSKKAKEALPLGDLTNVNLSTVNTSVLGVLLPSTGLVPMVTRCLCKGTCVRACACRTAGGSCSRRCSCKPSKCKRRAEAGGTGYSGQGAQQAACGDESKKVDEEDCWAVRAEEPSKYSPSLATTPSYPPIPLLASTSMVSTTAKKRNKKKLFTEIVGPQEL